MGSQELEGLRHSSTISWPTASVHRLRAIRDDVHLWSAEYAQNAAAEAAAASASAAAGQPPEGGEQQPTDIRSIAESYASLDQDAYFKALEELQAANPEQYDLVVAELNRMNEEAQLAAAKQVEDNANAALGRETGESGEGETQGEGDGFDLDPKALGQGGEGTPAGNPETPADPQQQS